MGQRCGYLASGCHHDQLYYNTIHTITKMKSMMRSLLLVLALTLSVSAQFQFFEQFFGGEQQQARDVPSDSSWYQQNYAKGMLS